MVANHIFDEWELLVQPEQQKKVITVNNCTTLYIPHTGFYVLHFLFIYLFFFLFSKIIVIIFDFILRVVLLFSAPAQQHLINKIIMS